MPVNNNQAQQPYDKFGQTVTYTGATGLTILPLAQAYDLSAPQTAPPSPVMQLSSPTGFIILEFDAERKGAWPVVPAPGLSSSVQGVILKHWEVAFFAPPLTEDGSTKLYKVMGRYVYAPQTPGFPGSYDVAVGKVPYDADAKAMNKFPAANFDQSLNPLNP